MKYLLILSLMINTVIACDFSTITKTDSGYLYTKECHLYVGKLVKSDKAYKIATKNLLESISLKDLALDTADTRIMKWRKESYNQHDRLLKQKKIDSLNDWLYFTGGFAIAILSVFAAGSVTK